jgi:hypothetical protein
MRAQILIAVAAAMLSPASVAAARVVDVSTADKVAVLMREAGYEAELRKPASGEDAILASAAGKHFGVLFSLCTHGQGCRAFQIYGVYDKDDIYSPELTNEWNTTFPFLKVFIDPEGRLVERVDVSTVGKMELENFRSYLDLYMQMDGVLREFIENKRVAAATNARKRTAPRSK